jgi:hypothetical protein
VAAALNIRVEIFCRIIYSVNMKYIYVGFEVLTAVVVNIYSLWYITRCSACYVLHAGFLPGLFFDPEDGYDMFFPKRRLTFNGLHGVISNKIELFM